MSGKRDDCARYVQPPRADLNMIGPMSSKALAILIASGAGLLGWLLWPSYTAEPMGGPIAPAAEQAVQLPPPLRTGQIEILRRDSISAALRRHEIAPATAHLITRALRDAGADMRRVRPGDRIELTFDADDRLLAVAYESNPWLRFEARADGDDWTGVRTEREPQLRLEFRQGAIENSLWDAVRSGALTPAMLLDLVQIFESEFDFSADARPGDRVRLLVQTRSADGDFVDHERIVAAQYQSEGRTLTAIGFEVAGRFAYYDGDGHSLRKTFLRSPLQFSRISSGFTHRRPHPILGGVRPHLAVDYAAPTGTPVWAVADGTVRFAGRNGGNGIQVRLRHRTGYETYYNHLSRIGTGIRPGARVKQKQVIGYVGSTGLSTGPHLDYRVARDGRFVNPLGENFLPGEPIPAQHRVQFLEQAKVMMKRLRSEPPPGT
jgi:murein DD-endopeptidase MepM/ murein hydrolase activator NlpD